MVSSTLGLVWSRIRYDWKRHATALAAVAILMASFLTFNAVAAGMEAGLQSEIQEEHHDRVQLNVGGFGGIAGEGAVSVDMDFVRALDGVTAVSARSAKASGIPVETSFPGGNNQTQGTNPNQTQGPGGFSNITSQIVLVGIDAQAESVLVEPGDADAGTPGGLFRGFGGSNYTLLQGRWIQGGSDAVATQSAANLGYGLGATFTVDGLSYTVVGIIANSHPANLNVPGVRSVGQLLVDRGTQSWASIGGAFLQVRPDFQTIQDVYTKLIQAYPVQTAALQANLVELERQYFEQARTEQVLSAAGRLVGLAGAATLFAMSLFLLIGERRAIGTMSSVGFSRMRLASYMTQKMVCVAALGSVAGAALGWVVLLIVDVPTVSFEASPAIDGATYSVATLQTLAAALLGSLVALILTIRKDPIQALTAAD